MVSINSLFTTPNKAVSFGSTSSGGNDTPRSQLLMNCAVEYFK